MPTHRVRQRLDEWGTHSVPGPPAHLIAVARSDVGRPSSSVESKEKEEVTGFVSGLDLCDPSVENP